jgi:cell division protein FtsW
MEEGHRDAFRILLAGGVLTLYGWVILFSATQGENGFFHKQLVWWGISLLGLGWGASVRLENFRSFAYGVGGLALTLLIGVLVLGNRINGSRRWLNFGPLHIQASEPAKIGYLLILSHYLHSRWFVAKEFLRGFLIPCGIIGTFCLLVILEPDFGTAFLFGTVGLLLLFLNGARLSFLIPSLLGAALLFSIAIYLNPVRLGRITSFLDLEGNRLTGAYQLWQSLVGFCSGGLTGVGLGLGRQQHSYLPEAHTDFILAILGEELGLIHVGLVIFLFAGIAYGGLKIVRRAASPFLFLLASGSLGFLVLQALLNMGVVTGLLPTKGLALPFISYGGSNLFTSYVFIGWLVNVAQTPVETTARLAQREL